MGASGRDNSSAAEQQCKLLRAFEAFDVNGGGKLTAEQFKFLLECAHCPEDDIEHALNPARSNLGVLFGFSSLLGSVRSLNSLPMHSSGQSLQEVNSLPQHSVGQSQQ